MGEGSQDRADEATTDDDVKAVNGTIFIVFFFFPFFNKTSKLSRARVIKKILFFKIKINKSVIKVKVEKIVESENVKIFIFKNLYKSVMNIIIGGAVVMQHRKIISLNYLLSI